VCSVRYSHIGSEGATAIAAGLRHVPSLTSLEYVCVEDRVWGVRQAGYSWGWVCVCFHHSTQQPGLAPHTHYATHVPLTDPTPRIHLLICPVSLYVHTDAQHTQPVACTACGACNSVCNLMCWCGWAVCSVSLNGIGDEGAAAIAAGLWHVPSLTSLKYVCVWRIGCGCETSCILYRGAGC
jgi:hypothetical protein